MKAKKYIIPILNELCEMTEPEQMQHIRDSNIGIDDNVDAWGNPHKNDGPYGSCQSSYFSSSWFHILPNYEYCSKKKPILPAFSDDLEKTIYLFVMTNNPLNGDDLSLRVYKSAGGGFVSFTLFSDENKDRSMVLMRNGYINPYLLDDIDKVKIKVIQMSRISDFFTLINKSSEIAFNPVMNNGLSKYKSSLEKDGKLNIPNFNNQSLLYGNRYSMNMSSGYLNYPMMQIIDGNKTSQHIIKENLKIVTSADRSRIHQLPLPIGNISLSTAKVIELKDLSPALPTSSDKFKAKFWPLSLSQKFDENCCRLSSLPVTYPGLSLFNLFKRA